jgi:uncharacterized protein (TIGR04255 family)
MNLPEFERVIYNRNPLVEVVCQLRFPPILKISHQEPVEFQDKVRHQYPLFETSQLQITPELLKQFGLTLQHEIAYNFKSEDKRWNLSITKDFIALTTSSYERFEQFKRRLREAVEIFASIYYPSFYTRVGLRYQDLIIRSRLNLEDQSWSNLISKKFSPELHDEDLAPSIETLMKNISFKDKDGNITLNHGLVSINDQINNINEIAYLFDADFYTEQKTELNGVWNVLNKFNKSAGKLFRWSITDTLHSALQPQSANITDF